jgi:hypothetical protein
VTFDEIPIGSIWIAADGGSYGYEVIGKSENGQDIIVADLRRQTPREINYFKLQYRYKQVQGES